MALRARSATTTAGMRFDLMEAGGALGDLGTFIPLLAGMVNRCGLQLGPALFCAGAMNLLTGLAFGIPMPVQPMKAIATVAIADGLSEPQILAAGILTGAIILVFGASGFIEWLNRAVPRSVVRGIQLALGLKLISAGIADIAGTAALRWVGWDSLGMGVLCAVVVLLLQFSNRIPGALVIFVIGLFALFASNPTLLSQTELGIAWRLPDLNDRADWVRGFLQGTLPQVPLTTLNSVIAVCALSVDLFPDRPAAPRRVAVSVGLMNLICCPLGGMPMCHGAGGLAAQSRFGARTGGSVVMLGAGKMLLALLFGGALLAWLQAYPRSVLGVLLTFSGMELALVCRDQTAKVGFFVMVLTAGACLAVNTAVGFTVGWIMAALIMRGVLRIEKPSA